MFTLQESTCHTNTTDLASMFTTLQEPTYHKNTMYLSQHAYPTETKLLHEYQNFKPACLLYKNQLNTRTVHHAFNPAC